MAVGIRWCSAMHRARRGDLTASMLRTGFVAGCMGAQPHARLAGANQEGRMIRKQFLIDEDRARRLKATARRLELPEAELIRMGIDRVLAERELDEDWLARLKQALEQ
jgi:hypothetical protein